MYNITNTTTDNIEMTSGMASGMTSGMAIAVIIYSIIMGCCCLGGCYYSIKCGHPFQILPQ